MSEENNNVETTNNTSKENNRPPRKLKLFINIDDSTKFKDRIFTHICKAKNQFPRKSNKIVSKVISVASIFENGWNSQVILYGPPGTSKTYLAKMIAARLLCGKVPKTLKDAEKNLKDMEEENRFKLVQFHPSYSYDDFVRGMSIKTDDKNGIKYEIESKIIEKFCNACNKENKNVFPKVLIIDEINRAPLGSVLGELIYGLEYRGQPISTPYELEDKPLIIPEGLYIIGTMNTADRTIGSIDYAVRRRFAFVQVPSDGSCIKKSWGTEVGEKASDLYNKLNDDKKGIFTNELLSDTDIDVEDIRIGHTYFLGKKDTNKENEKNEEKEEKEINYLKYRLQYQIYPIYLEYIKDGIIKAKEGKEAFANCVKSVFGEDMVKKLNLESYLESYLKSKGENQK